MQLQRRRASIAILVLAPLGACAKGAPAGPGGWPDTDAATDAPSVEDSPVDASPDESSTPDVDSGSADDDAGSPLPVADAHADVASTPDSGGGLDAADAADAETGTDATTTTGFLADQTWTESSSSANGMVGASTTGGGTSETFTYSDSSTDVYDGQMFTFQAVATGSTDLAYSWSYTGSHAYYEASAGLVAFADGPSGTTTVTLLASTTVSGDFMFSGSSTLTVTSGYAFGFTASGKNDDADDVVEGTIVISP